MGGYTKKEILEAVVETLKPLTVNGGGYVRHIAVRGLDDSPVELGDGALRTPAIVVSFSSSTYSPGQYAHMRETVGFEVVVVLTKGYIHSPEDVLSDVRGLLGGSTLGLDAGPVIPVRESPLDAGIHRSAYSALYILTQNVPLS